MSAVRIFGRAVTLADEQIVAGNLPKAAGWLRAVLRVAGASLPARNIPPLARRWVQVFERLVRS